VALPAWIQGAGRSARQIRQQAHRLLEQVGLGERAGHLPSELSGGEQQRVAVARALMNEPEIVFCDEPTGNLDSVTGRGILELLLGIHRQRGTTLVIVSHEPAVRDLAQRVYSLRDGQLWD
jgi:putative ABC transport system ATP-binding protein